MGYEYGAALSITRDPGIVNQFLTEGFGTSYNHTFWIGSDITFDEIFGNTFEAISRARIGFASGNFTSHPYKAVYFYDADSSRLFTTMNRFQVRSTQTLAQLDALLAYRPFDELRLMAGGWGSMRLASATYQVERIVEPEGAPFPQNTHSERLVDVGEDIETAPLRFGVIAGLGGEIRFSGALALRPAIFGRCDLKGIQGNLGMRAFSVEASVSLAFDFGAAREIRHPDTVLIVSGRSDIQASVNLFNADPSIGDSGRAVIRTRQSAYSQYVPLPPFLFFERNADSLPARYVRLGAGHPDSAPAPQSGARDPYEAYHNVLNILGRRMRDTPSSTVTLATTLSAENRALMPRRAEHLRTYLHEVWGIDRSRIRLSMEPDIACIPDTLATADYIRLLPSPATLLAPSVSKWLIQDHIVPSIGLTKKIRSALGVKSWELTIRQGSREISRFTAENEFNPENDAAIPISELALDSAIKPLVATLEVVDLVGGTAVVTDELRIELADTAKGPNREIRSYVLLEPIKGCPEILTINKVLISSISSSVQPNSRILISAPYRHTSGAWSASAVAGEILAALNASGVKPAELRVVNEPSRNEGDMDHLLPEEMILGRGVYVTIEQQPATASHSK